MRIKHVLYGLGTIVSDHGHFINVKFDNGSEMTVRVLDVVVIPLDYEN